MNISYLRNNPLLSGNSGLNEDYDCDEMTLQHYKMNYDQNTQILRIDGTVNITDPTPMLPKVTGLGGDAYENYPIAHMQFGSYATNPSTYVRPVFNPGYYNSSNQLYNSLGRIEKEFYERKHECKVNGCGRKFKRMEHLKRHQRIHTGERPFTCPVDGCGKKFSRSDNLAQHIRVHKSKLQNEAYLSAFNQAGPFNHF